MFVLWTSLCKLASQVLRVVLNTLADVEGRCHKPIDVAPRPPPPPSSGDKDFSIAVDYS